MPARADAGTLDRRARLARAVREDLAAAGLPVAADELAVAAGARVYVDELDDGGVFVDWDVHFALSSAAKDALSEGKQDIDPAIALAGAAARAMQDAIAAILTAAGYSVVKGANDMAPFQLLVIERRPGPCWQDWLHGQSARRERMLLATARNRTALGKPTPPAAAP